MGGDECQGLPGAKKLCDSPLSKKSKSLKGTQNASLNFLAWYALCPQLLSCSFFFSSWSLLDAVPHLSQTALKNKISFEM